MADSDTGALVIKILNGLAAVVLIVAGVWILVTTTFNHFSVWGFFTPIYLILYGVLLVAAELKQEWLLAYFGFLRTFLGRGLFYIFLSGVVSYVYIGLTGGHQTAALIYGSILFALGILYILLNFFPKVGSLSRTLEPGSSTV